MSASILWILLSLTPNILIFCQVEAHVVVNFAVGAAMLDPGHFDTASGLAGWTLLPGSWTVTMPCLQTPTRGLIVNRPKLSRNIVLINHSSHRHTGKTTSAGVDLVVVWLHRWSSPKQINMASAYEVTWHGVQNTSLPLVWSIFRWQTYTPWQ